MELRLLNKQGDYKWHLSWASAVKSNKGKIIKWLIVATEIHDQIEQREILENAVNERTKELSEANELLIDKYEELHKMNKELESFAYVSSHDLQEPLRKIQIFAGRILDTENEKLSDNGKKYFRIMQNSANQMQMLIDDLLSFSSLTSAERKFEMQDLNIIIEKVKLELKESIEEKNATIEVGDLCPVNIIVFQFHQLMQNLISNALKFSKPNHPSLIIIKSSIVEGIKLKKHKPALPADRLFTEKNYCHISVSDNGIGFNNKYREDIFEVFQRLHGKEDYPGTGIGLAIVRKIVDNHSGIITANSKVNNGTTFDIYIPAI
jgi:light-regulated signal transduction histidine kinase (bacteriophytochrome)